MEDSLAGKSESIVCGAVSMFESNVLDFNPFSSRISWGFTDFKILKVHSSEGWINSLRSQLQPKQPDLSPLPLHLSSAPSPSPLLLAAREEADRLASANSALQRRVLELERARQSAAETSSANESSLRRKVATAAATVDSANAELSALKEELAIAVEAATAEAAAKEAAERRAKAAGAAAGEWRAKAEEERLRSREMFYELESLRGALANAQRVLDGAGEAERKVSALIAERVGWFAEKAKLQAELQRLNSALSNRRGTDTASSLNNLEAPNIFPLQNTAKTPTSFTSPLYKDPSTPTSFTNPFHKDPSSPPVSHVLEALAQQEELQLEIERNLTRRKEEVSQISRKTRKSCRFRTPRSQNPQFSSPPPRKKTGDQRENTQKIEIKKLVF